MVIRMVMQMIGHNFYINKQTYYRRRSPKPSDNLLDLSHSFSYNDSYWFGYGKYYYAALMIKDFLIYEKNMVKYYNL